MTPADGEYDVMLLAGQSNRVGADTDQSRPGS